MTLTHIFVFATAALFYLFFMPCRMRKWALYIASVVAIFWLQPPIILRWLDFLFPTLTLGIVALSWVSSRTIDLPWTRDDSLAVVLMSVIIVGLSLGRYLAPNYRITPSSPPDLMTVAVWMAAVLVATAILYHAPIDQKRLSVILMLALLAVFIVLKTTPLAEEVSRQLRLREGRPTALASASELSWLGFSYVAFRLIHTLRDRQTGRLPSLTLREYVTYVIFFPALTAGPIDRADRFISDLRQLPTLLGLDPERIVQGVTRIALGVGKKFIIADSLAYMALDATKAELASSAGGLWVLLYCYALQIYFDFSGYSDIAIGLGQLYGIKLPENFNRPYLKRNITLFWQSWHITLSQWVRFYVFSPLSRYLLMRKHKPSPAILAVVGQLTTMLVIGLWHGVTWGFAVWGLWHGIGLFVHKLYSDKTRHAYIRLRDRPQLNMAIGAAGTLLTFHFVVLGWVWFALPDIATSWDVLIRLLGM